MALTSSGHVRYRRKLQGRCDHSIGGPMRLLPAVLGVAVVSTVVSVNLWRELHAERQLTTDLRNQMLEARKPADVQPPPVLTPTPAPRPIEEARPSQPVAEVSEVQVGPVQSLSAVAPGAQNAMLMADPGYRKAMMAQTLINLRAMNLGLVEEMGLSTQEADEFFDLLAAHQIEQSEEMARIRPSGPIDAAMRESLQKSQAEGQARLEDSLTALLGRDRFLQYKDYQETRSARNVAGNIGNMLAQAGQPLSAAQMRPFISAMATAQKRQQTELQAISRSAVANTPQAAMQQRELQLKRTEESNRILLETVGRHLTPQQLAVYRAQLESQLDQTRAALRLQQERDRVLRALQGGTQ